MGIHPVLWLNIIVITAFIAIIGIGWIWWASRPEWPKLRLSSRILAARLKSPFRVRARWLLTDIKWTAIQLYQKFTRRRYKK